jgi:dTDP-4-dehydrorhamnose 3,5-epimerase-like enzyme
VTKTIFDLSDITLCDLPRHVRDDGEVVVAEGGQVPFTIARLFVVRAPRGATRGQHAHRRCTQMMICVNGALDIECDDGSRKKTFTLDRGNLALILPPSIWASLVFRKPDSALAVLCDRPYEEHDYIRDYQEFSAMRKKAVS